VELTAQVNSLSRFPPDPGIHDRADYPAGQAADFSIRTFYKKTALPAGVKVVSGKSKKD